MILPTETVYGLATKPDAPNVARLFEIKNRPPEKNVQLLIDDGSWLDRLAIADATARALAQAFWPGPLTLVVRASEGAPQAVVDDGSIGLRVPAHPLALELLRSAGPLAASSANRSGEPTPATIEELEALFGTTVDAYLDGGTIVGTGSTVVDLRGHQASVLRPGPIPPHEIARIIQLKPPGLGRAMRLDDR